MNNITPLNFEGAAVRLLQIDGEPWFVAADVCEVLDVQNVAQAAARLDDDERSMFNIGRQGEVHIINESGLYSLVLGSRKPEARRFRKWVTGAVLPTIRKTGSYALATPRTMAQALRLAADQVEKIEVQQAQLAIAAPKVEFVDQYVESTGLKGFREVAKLLNIKENWFRKFLTDHKIMYLLGKEWAPYAPHLVAGRFEIKTGTNLTGAHAFTEAKFTPKGVTWIAGLITAERVSIVNAQRAEG